MRKDYWKGSSVTIEGLSLKRESPSEYSPFLEISGWKLDGWSLTQKRPFQWLLRGPQEWRVACVDWLAVSDYRSAEQCILFFDLLWYLFAEMLVKCVWFIYIDFWMLRRPLHGFCSLFIPVAYFSGQQYWYSVKPELKFAGFWDWYFWCTVSLCILCRTSRMWCLCWNASWSRGLGWGPVSGQCSLWVQPSWNDSFVKVVFE